nr:MAG TPA: hypothetical protein [Caudoviricetes sp.]
MYTIQKTQAFEDTLRINGENSETLDLHIRMNTSPQLVKEYRGLQIQLIDAQKKLKEQPGSDAALSEIGEATIRMIALLFGEDNTRKMQEFYGGDYVTMFTDIFPYIQNVIAPKIQEMAKERKAQFKRRFK